MPKLIVANWKLNPQTITEAEKLFRAVAITSRPKNVEVVICPPFPYILNLKSKILNLNLGAQNVFWEERGAYTGEVSAAMLKNLGVKYVIIGHSERRRWLNETDEMVNKKVSAGLKARLKVILCVGEPERKQDLRFKNYELRRAKNYVRRQLKKDLKGIPKSKFINLKSLIIVYEPVWAISANPNSRADKPEDALEMIKFIKEILHSTFPARHRLRRRPIAGGYILHSRVLYGGSVTSQNIKDFLRYKEIDGALVGGASLNAKEFKKVVQTASKQNG